MRGVLPFVIAFSPLVILVSLIVVALIVQKRRRRAPQRLVNCPHCGEPVPDYEMVRVAIHRPEKVCKGCWSYVQRGESPAEAEDRVAHRKQSQLRQRQRIQMRHAVEDFNHHN